MAKNGKEQTRRISPAETIIGIAVLLALLIVAVVVYFEQFRFK